MKFNIYLKSYTDQPDYEDSILANSKAEAIEMFYDDLKSYGWEKEVIEENVKEDDLFNLKM